jgi:hypothetical protein
MQLIATIEDPAVIQGILAMSMTEACIEAPIVAVQ